jgi:hypothetical protein
MMGKNISILRPETRHNDLRNKAVRVSGRTLAKWTRIGYWVRVVGVAGAERFSDAPARCVLGHR